jgi:hypothetical protein
MGKKRYVMPEGYRYDVDGIGPKVVRISDGRDYHAAGGSSGHLYPELLISKLKELDVIRDKQAAYMAGQAATEMYFMRDIKTTRVTLHDSCMAGNCVTGSLTFAHQRLGLERDKVVPLNAPPVKAEVLIRTGDKRAINAAHKAWQRETLVCI